LARRKTVIPFVEMCRRVSKNDRLTQAIFIVAGIALFGYVLLSIRLSDIYNAFVVMGVNVLLIVAVLAFEVVASSLRMRTLIRKAYDVPMLSIMRIMFETTIFAVYSPGKVGELMKLDLFKSKGVKRSYCLASVVVSRAFDLVVVLLMSAGALLSLGVSVTQLAILAAAAVLGVVALLVVLRLGLFRGFVYEVIQSFKTLLDFQSIILVFLLTAALWAADASIPYIVLRTLGYNVEFFQVATIYFASLIIGLVSMIPGGLGASEFSFSYGISHLLGVAEADAVSSIVMVRMITFVVFSIGGLMYFKHMKDAGSAGKRKAKNSKR